MSNQEPHIDYQELMAKYLSGNAEDQEVKALEQWVQSTASNKAEFMAFKKAWMLSSMQDDRLEYDTDKEWKALEGMLGEEAKVVTMPKRKLTPFLVLRLAAALALLVAATWFVLGPGNQTVQYTADAGIQEQTLPDGSVVTLNQFASLSYTPPDKSGIRKVKLEGDAFFDVARDEEYPFIIGVEDIEVQVLGTSFYVDGRKENPEIQVSVQSGSVEVRTQQESVLLAPEQSAIFDKADKSLEKIPTEDDNFMAWKTGVLSYQDANLEEVVFDLNRSYETVVKLENQDMANCPITTTFNDKTLDSIIRIIEETLGVSSSRQNGEIILTGTCD
ncbi:MAG: DUF4974 domain-containing protein [Saprospiraceae bacterium]|nr:DUF4974 domain-containing protein [Saprospiraceae bacterium]